VRFMSTIHSPEWLTFSRTSTFIEDSRPVAQSSGTDPIVGMRALVIEDEFLIAIDVQRILETAGAREVVLVARVVDAQAALDGPEPFDIAVLDILLGEESGESIAKQLVERRIPFVYSTGMGPFGINAEDAGLMPIVPKPYSSATLLSGLAKAIAVLRT